MGTDGGPRAWAFLRRNRVYRAAWRGALERPVFESAPFAVRVQSSVDRQALAWGSLGWEDPHRPDGNASGESGTAPASAPGGSFSGSQKRPSPTGESLCWIGVRVARDRPGRPRRRGTTWDKQRCFSPRSRRPNGWGSRHVRSSASGGRARARRFTASVASCAISRRTWTRGW